MAMFLMFVCLFLTKLEYRNTLSKFSSAFGLGSFSILFVKMLLGS